MEIPILLMILVLILFLPFLIRRVEEELEIFLFVMGLVAVVVTGKGSLHLAQEVVVAPWKIALAVLIFGFAFAWGKDYVAKGVDFFLARHSGHTFFFLLVLLLGFSSSIITAIIAALVLVEVISALNMDRRTETEFAVIACFAIGLGACLTPIGEPLSTIAVEKLKGPPYHADFFFMLRFLGWPVLVGVVVLALAAGFLHGHKVKRGSLKDRSPREDSRRIVVRALKVYLFVAGLHLLGSAYEIIIKTYIVQLHPYILYFINIVSAVLDNATLTAAEIGPDLGSFQIKTALLSLLVSGGILIPGNIPNIICANKLRIGSRAWARYGLPLGGALLAFYFVWVYLSQ